MECTYRKCSYEHDEYYLVKLYGTTVYVAKACNLSRIGSEEGAENIRETKLMQRFSNRWANGICDILNAQNLKSFIEENLCRNYAFKCISSVTKFGYFFFNSLFYIFCELRLSLHTLWQYAHVPRVV